MTLDTWHLTPDIWHVTYNGGLRISKIFDSLGVMFLGIWCLEDREEKDESINESMNTFMVYGLWFMVQSYSVNDKAVEQPLQHWVC